MRSLTLLALAACSDAASRPTVPPTAPEAPPHVAHETPSLNRAMAPVVHAPPAAGSGCALRWDEVDAPERIALATTLDEECLPVDLGPDLPPPSVTTETGRMHGGVTATLTVDGPSGSGRFLALGLSVGTGARQRHACLMGSTVGWRYMHSVATQLAPLPFLSDVDRDGAAELVVWGRLPWGDSEVDNALLPIVYVLDGDVLVRRDDRAKLLNARVAAAYRARAQLAERGDPTACFLAVAQFLDS